MGSTLTKLKSFGAQDQTVGARIQAIVGKRARECQETGAFFPKTPTSLLGECKHEQDRKQLEKETLFNFHTICQQ
jgi:hypothetical protein